jgi:hypothetical protein
MAKVMGSIMGALILVLLASGVIVTILFRFLG